MKMNLPNKLTVLRLCLVPVILVIGILPETIIPYYISCVICATLFIGTAVTDMLDGKIARRDGLITDFGKFLDPIADKLLVSAALLALCNVSIMYLWATLVILAREFVVSGIRMLAASKGNVIAAGKLGKLKMIFQTVAIITLFVAGIVPTGLWSGFEIIQDIIYFAGNIIMVGAVVLTIVSGVEYVKNNIEVLSLNNK